jgi:predicted nuclease of predicted toxin-antitoxin system
LASATDDAVWRFAADLGYTIVTKDDDFRQRSFLEGAPPKVIWVKIGNCRSEEIEHILRLRHAEVCAFASDAATLLLVLSRRGER